MSENKPTIGLSWAPKVPLISSGTKTSSEKLQCPPQDTVWKQENKLVDGLFLPPTDPRKLNKLLKKQVKDTTGKSWFEMPAPTITPEIKKDLQILKMRSVIDPKRHYKKGDSNTLPKYFQVGTVIESASDFFSGRLTKKERKPTLADELLSDRSLGDYRKRKVRDIEEQHQSVGVAKWKIKGKQTWKRAKQRRQ
ncbi:rRNA-processing protein fcf2-like [Magnolia sinica]|uniref:rRNA-processing protein fcf2-like n=1 Tax=Magnolia sinica TaxID=86752 RepID=UPI0026583CA2|nr:rRNA-processing protein fcf2-like [Magnolia sinica]